MGTRLRGFALAATVMLLASSVASALNLRIKLPPRPPPPKPAIPAAKPVPTVSFDPQAKLATDQIAKLEAIVKKSAADNLPKAKANHDGAKKYEGELVELLK